MKHFLPLFVLFFGHSSIFCAFRNNAAQNPQAQPEQPILYIPASEPNQIEEDKKIDQALFVHFVKILGNFTKILINPHDKINVTSNVAQMIDGVVSVVHELTKRNNVRNQQLDNLVRLIMSTLVKQGLIPPTM